MDRPIDPITDYDLGAYVDDQLPVERRIQVADYLSRHPGIAARVMADLRNRDELRLAFPSPRSRPRAETVEAAIRLGAALTRGRRLDRLRRIAAVAIIGAGGWLAHAAFGPLAISDSVALSHPPAFVDEALQAHQTVLVRALLHPAAPPAAFNADEVRAATAIELPDLPAGWRVRDVQIFPSTFGPSVEVTIDADNLGTLSLFAVRPGSFEVTPVVATGGPDIAAAYWQMGEVAYALAGKASGASLVQAAAGLSRTLF